MEFRKTFDKISNFERAPHLKLLRLLCKFKFAVFEQITFEQITFEHVDWLDSSNLNVWLNIWTIEQVNKPIVFEVIKSTNFKRFSKQKKTKTVRSFVCFWHWMQILFSGFRCKKVKWNEWKISKCFFSREK